MSRAYLGTDGSVVHSATGFHKGQRSSLWQVKQVVRNQAGWPWLPVIGRKRGAFRGPDWLSILHLQQLARRGVA